jgi:hydroxymethylglutaryl-CoA lyase
MNQRIELVECPRDAMQGWPHFIPTPTKVEYINALLKVGFGTIDFGSFVSPKAIPQMADTKDVIPQLDLSGSSSKLLAIVANTRGAEEAAVYEEISLLGFPFSISETFQQRNTNSSIEESLKRVEEIQRICINTRKQLVVYISMGFGNPYHDPYNEELVYNRVNQLVQMGIGIISLADTVGVASPEQVHTITRSLIQQLPGIEIGVHLHSSPLNWQEKFAAAVEAGCRRFDGAMKGIGGCPMADDELVGNMNMEWMVEWLEANQLPAVIDMEALAGCSRLADRIFTTHE